MDLFLAIVGWTAFALAVLAGLVLDLLGLFGNWIILGAVAVAWLATGFEHFSARGLLVIAVLAVLGEVAETAAAGFGAAKFGGGKGSIAAAIVGCIAGAVLGTPLFPVVGTLAGACVGAFAAATLYEYVQMEKEVRLAVWTGLGAALGKAAGLFAKTFLGLIILLVAYLTY